MFSTTSNYTLKALAPVAPQSNGTSVMCNCEMRYFHMDSCHWEYRLKK